MKAKNTISILGMGISRIDLLALLEEMRDMIVYRRQGVILYANIHTISQGSKLIWLKSFYNNADIVFCDGVGVQWGAKILGEDIPERFTPPDWFPDLCQLCVDNDFSMFLLGTKPGISAKVAEIYEQKFPGLNICGTYHGYFDKTYGGEENAKVVKLINDASPDILLVGFGMPIQEKWLKENMGDLNSKVHITVGAMFDFLAGETYRGPRWLTDNGFEWLTRLLTEPGRLWKRYIIGIPLFFFRILKQKYMGEEHV